MSGGADGTAIPNISAPSGVIGRLALKQKANQLNYRSTFIYLLFIKHVTKKSLTLSNQAFSK
ncbi:hypothetical protein [Photobacterium damselae]|uniref:hypothetical protein n=1 Tax=Photobacterium damselae TaxID=38293 RepID=UPI00254326B1